MKVLSLQQIIISCILVLYAVKIKNPINFCYAPVLVISLTILILEVLRRPKLRRGFMLNQMFVVFVKLWQKLFEVVHNSLYLKFSVEIFVILLNKLVELLLVIFFISLENLC